MATLALGDSNYGLVRSLRDPSIPTFTLGATPPLAGKVRGTQLVVYIYISLLEFFEIVFKPLLSPAHDVLSNYKYSAGTDYEKQSEIATKFTNRVSCARVNSHTLFDVFYCVFNNTRNNVTQQLLKQHLPRHP